MKQIFSNRWLIWTIVFIVVVGVGIWGYTQYLIINIDKEFSENELMLKPNQLAENTSTSEEELKVQETTEINPKNYSLVTYPLKDSPVYEELDNESVAFGCDDIYWKDSKDMRLVKNDGEVLIPSLLQVISASDNSRPTCETRIGLFSASTDEKYLYLKTTRILTHGGYPGLSGIYSLDLSNLTIKKLSISDFVGRPGLYTVLIEDTYYMLTDGKSLVKWNMDGVYLVNLESDSKINLYTAPENQWLISSISLYETARTAFYDVNVDNGLITVGVYDKIKKENGESVSVNEYGRISLDINYGETMKFKFIKQITLYVPGLTK